MRARKYGSRGKASGLLILPTSLVLFACGEGVTEVDQDPPGERTGSIEVVLQMSGGGTDPDGSIVTVDADASTVLLASDSHTFTGLAPGEHDVVISGIADNCTLEGEAARSVSVIATLSTPVLFRLDCRSEEPGSIEVSTLSVGSALDSDGYTLVFEGADHGPMGVVDTVTLPDLPVGTASVGLSGVGGGCQVIGDNPVSVSVSGGQTTTVAFDVTCPPFHDYIAYISGRSGDLDIWVMEPDGSSRVNLTRDAAGDEYPTWSPDGMQLVFSRSDGIHIFDTSDLSTRRVTSTGGCPCTWAPDGSRLAYTVYSGGPPGAVYAIDADGSNSVLLTPERDGGFEPAWSPDGSRIAFCRETNGDPDLWLMDPDGSNQVRITNLLNVQLQWRAVFDPAWSPDGFRIAFTGPGDSQGPRIWVVDADGSNIVKLTPDRPAYQAWRPAWSPDGSRIAFWARQGLLLPPYNFYEIYVMNADGSNEVDITNHAGYDVNPSWSW